MLQDLIIYAPIFITFFWAVTFLSTSSKKPDNNHKRILGFFMLTAVGIYTSHAFYFQNLRSVYWLLDSLYAICSLSVFPLYYFYLRGLTKSQGLEKKDFLAFIPAVLVMMVMLLNYVWMGESARANYINAFLYESGEQLSGGFGFTQSLLYKLSRIIYTLQILFFMLKGIALLQMYELRILNFYSYLEGKQLSWTNLLTYTFFIASLISIIFNLIGKATFVHNVQLLIIPSLLFSIILFLIGLQANVQIPHMNLVKVKEKADDARFPLDEPVDVVNLGEKLEKLFSEMKIHLNPHLKITDISKSLATNRTYISHYINHERKQSFSSFVNAYRLKEAKRLLKKDANHALNLEDIAEMAGFGSLRSFTRAFTQEEGITPTQYRENTAKKG